MHIPSKGGNFPREMRRGRMVIAPLKPRCLKGEALERGRGSRQKIGKTDLFPYTFQKWKREKSLLRKQMPSHFGSWSSQRDPSTSSLFAKERMSPGWCFRLFSRDFNACTVQYAAEFDLSRKIKWSFFITLTGKGSYFETKKNPFHLRTGNSLYAKKSRLVFGNFKFELCAPLFCGNAR